MFWYPYTMRNDLMKNLMQDGVDFEKCMYTLVDLFCRFGRLHDGITSCQSASSLTLSSSLFSSSTFSGGNSLNLSRPVYHATAQFTERRLGLGRRLIALYPSTTTRVRTMNRHSLKEGSIVDPTRTIQIYRPSLSKNKTHQKKFY